MRRYLYLLVIMSGLLSAPGLVQSAEDQQQQPGTDANGAPIVVTDAERSEAQAIFAGQCGWCHGSYGMTADKGPALVGTKMTEREVQERIRNGKPGYMPSFHKFLNEQQIALMAKYVKSLKPDD